MRGQTEHPPQEAFQRLVRGEASPEETRVLVRHLLEGCPSCSRAAEKARRAPSRELSYDVVFERLEERLNQRITGLLAEQAMARDLYLELLDHQAVEGLTQVHGTRRYASLALCELLLQKSRELMPDDPGQARRTTDLAVGVAEQLDLELYGAPVIQDTQGVAWAYFAETSRIQADLRTAESSMGKAGRLAEGSGDPLVRAELLSLQASLRSYGGRFEEALGLLNRVASIYRRCGERHLLGRTLLKKGTVLGNAGKAGLAVRLIRHSMDLIDAPREPRLMVYATHNYIWFLNEGAHRQQALSCLKGARRLYEAAGDRRDLGRLRWLEGKLATGLDEAERALLDARDGLAREGLAYEAALAAMDLAVRYAGERKASAMRRQAEQMLPLFRSAAMYQDTMIALLSYQQRDGAETGKLIEELGSHLARSREEKNPPALARRLGG